MATQDQQFSSRLFQNTRKNLDRNSLGGLQKALLAVSNDRQPDAQKQTAETEWRRQRDIYSSINRLRDILSALLAKMADGTASPLTVRGQLIGFDGNSDAVLDPPTVTRNGGGPGILITSPTSPTGFAWDTDLWQTVQDCCGGGGINSIDYGLITEPMAESDDYGGVANPPTSSYDWGRID